MNRKEFDESLVKYAKKINININETQLEKFYSYMQLLLEWNKKINLTAITDENEIILKHFIDSLTISKHIESESYIIDVGTGAGFPGIPLKIIREDVKIVLLDSLNKRISFLNEIIKALNLENIEAIHGRAEEIAKNKKYREKFNIVTSRAVANLSTLSEYMLPLTKVSGKAICMKGKEIENEINDAKNAINILGGKITDIEQFQLIDNDINRSIVIINKVKNTTIKNTRKAGTPSKEPLK